MAGFSKNPFELLSEDFEDVPKEKEAQKKKKPVVIVGTSGGERKKPIFPGETPKKKKSKAPAAKSTTKPAQPSTNVTAKNISAPAVSKASTEPSYELLHAKAAPFVSAMERMQPSHSVLFKVVLPEKSSLLVGLRERAFRTLEDLLRLDSFNSTFSSALQSRFKALYATGDFRSKPIRVQGKKLMRGELVERLIGLVKKGDGVSEGEACRLVLDLFSTLFSGDDSHNSFLERLQEDIGSKVGSQGNVRNSQGPTLSDFIVEKPVKRKGKGKGGKASEESKLEKSETVESPAAVEEKVEEKVDPLYNVDTLTRCFPRGWQAALLQPTFLLQKKDVSEGQPRNYYFSGKDNEGAIVMWSDHTREIIFFIYNLN